MNTSIANPSRGGFQCSYQ
uniref:Uncharacterized protein n=1 Tax=Arundo donax TaxID=35708 RepID=A0A0A9H036_ARUDO